MKYNYTIGYLAGGGFSFNSYANYRWQLLLSPIQYLAHFVLSRFAVTDRVSLTFLLLCTFIMHLLWQTNLMNMHKHLFTFPHVTSVYLPNCLMLLGAGCFL